MSCTDAASEAARIRAALAAAPSMSPVVRDELAFRLREAEKRAGISVPSAVPAPATPELEDLADLARDVAAGRLSRVVTLVAPGYGATIYYWDGERIRRARAFGMAVIETEAPADDPKVQLDLHLRLGRGVPALVLERALATKE